MTQVRLLCIEWEIFILYFYFPSQFIMLFVSELQPLKMSKCLSPKRRYLNASLTRSYHPENQHRQRDEGLYNC
jgi:hypothetical protein